MGHVRLKESILTDPTGAGKSAATRDLSDAICRRLSWLSGQDRLLLEMVYRRGLSCRQIACLMNLPASSVSRRIQKLTGRLLSRDYSICLLHRGQLVSLQLKIARDRFAAGLTRKAIARRHHISLYRVDRHLRDLRKLIAKYRSEQTKKKIFHLREGA